MKHLAGLFVMLFACLGAPALAQEGDELMPALAFEELRAIVTELDFDLIKEGVDEDGDYYFEVKSDTGLLFYLYGASCDDKDPQKDCMGLNAVGSFTLDTDADMHVVMNSIRYAFMKVYRSDDRLKISRYVIFDGGIMRENVKENVRIFAEIGDAIWSKLTDDGVLAD